MAVSAADFTGIKYVEFFVIKDYKREKNYGQRKTIFTNDNGRYET